MIVGFTIATFLSFLFLFHKIMIRNGSISEKQWEGIDYVWYGFGTIALLLVTIEVVRLHDISELGEGIKKAEVAQFEIEKLVQATKPSSCKDDPKLCNLLEDISKALNETMISSDWPLGPITFNRQEYRSWNVFLTEQAKEHRVEKFPTLLIAHTVVGL